MGMYIAFSRVTPNELDRAENDPVWAREFIDDLYERDRGPDDPDGGLDKAWAGIQYLLDAAGAGIELQMDGFPIGKDGRLSGWTVDGVRDAAKKLRALPFERLAGHYDPARMMEADVYPGIWDFDPDGGLEYLKGCYGTLVGFFDATAASGSAAIMDFSY